MEERALANAISNLSINTGIPHKVSEAHFTLFPRLPKYLN